MPMINMFVKAGESFVVSDPKGELYKRTSGIAKANGYEISVINFRDIGKGDMWNPIALPYEMYHSGKKEEAIALLNDFISTIAEPHFKNTADVIWPNLACSLALANLLLLMECGRPEEANVGSLARMCANDNEAFLMDINEKIPKNTLAGINYSGVLTGAERTRQSVYVTLYGMVRIFSAQKQLTRMLSGNTVDIKSFGKKKSAVYIIVPDEKTTYHFLVTTFIKPVYELLISEAQNEKEKTLPIRVNFVLDEFCNIPKIPDMPSMISAARSRNMRFFLVAQSLHQLTARYGEDAATIKGNCDNWVFLTSKEYALLKEISDLCGSVSDAGEASKRPLISISELQRLDKQKGEALIMHARQYPIITEIADIDSYPDFMGYPEVGMKTFELPKNTIFSVEEYYRALDNERVPIPFLEESRQDG
jgi:type IV secretion system protein VirD4